MCQCDPFKLKQLRPTRHWLLYQKKRIAHTYSCVVFSFLWVREKEKNSTRGKKAKHCLFNKW